MIQQMLAIWSLIPLPFLNPAWTSGSSQFMYCWSLAWRILSITLLSCEMSAIVWYSEHSLALPFFGTGMKTDLFQSFGPCWVFQICWCIECRTFIASSFRIFRSRVRSWLNGDLLFRMVQYSVSCFIREPPNSVGIFFCHTESPQRIAHYFLSLLFCFLLWWLGWNIWFWPVVFLELSCTVLTEVSFSVIFLKLLAFYSWFLPQFPWSIHIRIQHTSL